MSALNWKTFIERGEERIEEVPKKSIEWKDIVTGTKYFFTESDYNSIISDLSKSINNLKYDELVRFFDNNEKFQHLPWKEGKSKPALIDAARLYVLFSHILDKSEKDNRHVIYKDFISGKYNANKAYKTLICAVGEKISKEDEELLKNTKIFLVKGGAFKVKKYFLENNKLKDMRGASTLLTYVTEKKIPEIVSQAYIDEALIYSGGGNVMCILPNEDLAYKVCSEFEKCFDKYTLTVENAFSYYSCSLYDILKDYKKTMRKLEAVIENRKKLKIYNNITPISELNNKKEGIDINNKTILIEAKTLEREEICSLCSLRNASYIIVSKEEGRVENVCGSCLHKNRVGSREKLGYYNKFENYIGKKYHKNVTLDGFGSIDEIADKNGEIAVIYGDGNNIGAIVQNISNLYEMMYFSRKMQNAANKAVYEAIYKSVIQNNINNKGKKIGFEIIAVGGDDIFFIVPADKALVIGRDLIDIFNEQFINKTEDKNTNKHNATMSIGIVISKARNDIRKLVEIAQKELKNAKEKERELYLMDKNSGSISVLLIKGSDYLSREFGNNNNERIKRTMFPMGKETFRDFLIISNKLKYTRKISSVKRVDEAAKKMCLSEFMLFYLYNEAKNSNVLYKIFQENKLELYEFEKGIFKYKKKNGDTEIYSPWSDILDFWHYVGGNTFEK